MKAEPTPWGQQDLPGSMTLKLLRGEEVLFTSDRHWLHPLFELDTYFRTTGAQPAGTLLVDRVTGRAAACLMARMGLPRLRTGILSRLAIPILEAHGIACLAREIVDRIPCATESELETIEDLETAYGLLQARRATASLRP